MAPCLVACALDRPAAYVVSFLMVSEMAAERAALRKPALSLVACFDGVGVIAGGRLESPTAR